MPESQHHIIHTLKYEVHFAGDYPSEQQNVLSRIHSEKVQVLLQELLDSISPKDDYLRITSLELNLGIISSQNWQNTLVGELGKALHKKIHGDFLKPRLGLKNPVYEDTVEPPEITLFTGQERNEDNLLFFLQKGYLSWIAGKEQPYSINGNFERILEHRSGSFDKKLQHLLLRSGISLRRFVNQIYPGFQSQWLENILPGAGALSEEIFSLQEQMKKYPAVPDTIVNKICLWLEEKLILHILDRHPETITSEDLMDIYAGELLEVFHSDILRTVDMESLKSEVLPENKILQLLISKLSVHSTVSGSLEMKYNQSYTGATGKESKRMTDESGFKEDFTKGLMAENGGLILLWPFLKILFSQFALLGENSFRGADEQIMAVYMLHYLATGTVDAGEHELLIPKIITDYDIGIPVPSFFGLNENISKECDHLLSTVIKYWAALKSTSIDGLRRTFLQRYTLLKLKEDGWHFMFERKGVDILIDRLPYALSVIKLKWLKNPIYVSW